jgi:hypothetical protein
MLTVRTTPPSQAKKAHPAALCNPPAGRGRAALPVLPPGGQARALKSSWRCQCRLHRGAGCGLSRGASEAFQGLTPAWTGSSGTRADAHRTQPVVSCGGWLLVH